MIETLSLKRLLPFSPFWLRQLVTLSFVLILLPLLVLAWQAWQKPQRAERAGGAYQPYHAYRCPPREAMINGIAGDGT